MAIDQNTHMNDFSKGMNTDTSDAFLDKSQYRLANNLRYVTNTEENSGELHMIEGAHKEGILQRDDTVLAATQLRDIGIIITQYTTVQEEQPVLTGWRVYTIENGPLLNCLKIVDINSTDRVCNCKLSLVTRWEDDDNKKLYIADGKGPILCIKLFTYSEVQSWNPPFSSQQSIDTLVSPSVVHFEVPKFCGLIDGSLKSGMYEYSYQFYIKNGPQTEISPSTNLIPLHDGPLNIYNSTSQKGINGYEKDVKTNKGIKIQIPIDQKYSRLKIYRIHYAEVGVPPIIGVVFDGDISNTNGTIPSTYTFSDTGIDLLSVITLDEYNMMTGIHIIPKTIESMVDYMFASNIRSDNPIYLNDTTWDPQNTNNVDYYFIRLQLEGDRGSSKDYIDIKNISHNAQPFSTTITNGYFYVYDKNGIALSSGNEYRDTNVDLSRIIYNDNNIDQNKSYANPYVSYSLKSLRRGETYRYGIILYDKWNNATAVKHIADIQVPDINKLPIFDKAQYPIQQNLGDTQLPLCTYSVGIRFVVKNLPSWVESYEIVRCGRDSSNISTVMQCVVSRPISLMYDEGTDNINPRPQASNSVLTPTGFVTNMDCWYGVSFLHNSQWIHNAYDTLAYAGNGTSNYWATNSTITGIENSQDIVGNKNIFQVISPEYCYQSETIKDMLDSNSLTIEPLSYLYPAYNNGYRQYFDQQQNSAVSWNWNAAGEGMDSDTRKPIPGFIYPGTGNVYGREDGGSGSEQRYNIGNDWANIIIKDTLQDPNSGENQKAISIDTSVETIMCYYMKFDELVLNVDGADFQNVWSKRNADRFEYIKLYNYIKDEGGAHAWADFLDTIPSNIKIENTAYPDSLGWDDFATVAEDWTLKYTDKLTAIGTKNFCNWVSGGLYGTKDEAQVGEGVQFTNARGNLGNTSTCGGMMGPGGKCMLIQVDNDFLAKVPDQDIVMGTYLCNIKQASAGYPTDKTLSTYRSYGNYFDRSVSIADVFDGDCFVQPFEYISQHKWAHPYLSNHRDATIIYAIPMETSINLAYTYGYEFSKNKNNTNGNITLIQVNPSNVNNEFIQTKPLYAYNSVYSANSTSKTKVAEGSKEDDWFDQDQDYRVYNSVAKSNDEFIDNWLKFLPANFIDVDTRYGEITGLRKFNNSLIFWQECATGLLSVNERVQIVDDKDMPLTLGTADVLSRYDYMNTSNGMRKDEYADTQSDTTLYWWDHNKHEILGYSGGTQVVSISKAKQVQNLLNEMHTNNKLINNPLLWHDKQFNEVIFGISDGDGKKKGSLVFGENIGAFSALYTILPAAAITFKNTTLLLDDSGAIYRWNTFSGSQNQNEQVKDIEDSVMLPYLKYVVNPNSVYTKVFDNVEFGGRVYGGSDTITFNQGSEDEHIIESRTYKDGTLSNRMYDIYSPSPLNKLSFTFKTPLKQQGTITGDKIDNTEYNFRFAIPRDNNSSYGGRLKGKTMQVELTSTSSSYDFSLQYILTKYRISWT